ncbi:23S rRNA (adenine(2030)-N(6))-methyltransferase RlmJ [Suttonella sp. R2A3]|uniref:23S rRNA (adenine(2030)-N(6))-methyltransferase RlmJ n=1 Tax=Suttonella sp. R2A3 TaxID=2908648 RepID=UPI001F3E4FC6|nr:23S rRNA (adenine(2030)-N(6))-methyltransferase RlmJ [Suttonella sp. R2A3]UJF25094.1 23S rRNA (adenine(2030)-N(6))-methyltransferase RlmJ [Suttonella sp. R2A3]
MLSYRHGFHAGNHADILKHFVLYQALEHYLQKDKPFIYADTHAGAGLYDLHATFATQNQEYDSGITRLRNAENLPPKLNAFLKAIDDCTSNQQFYPGSPLLAASLLRRQDYLRLFELHPSDYTDLDRLIKKGAMAKRASIEQRDGLKGALAYLPPPNRRALVLMDPSYEVKSDYQAIPKAIAAMHQRCREACIMLWYPLLNRDELPKMLDAVKTCAPDAYLRAELRVLAASQPGMTGSGMLVINPPYRLSEALTATLPELTTLLSQDPAHSSWLLRP